MKIMDISYPKKVKFQGTKINVNAGEDLSPALNQHFEWHVIKPRFKEYQTTLVCSAECGFDIETTTVDGGAYMYKWQLVFGEYLISGRKWEEFFTTMQAIETAYNFGVSTIKVNGKEKKVASTLIMWIANQGYEFQFFCRRKWMGNNIIQLNNEGFSDVFADSMRKPIKTVLSFAGKVGTGAIVAMDALKFSTSLAQLAKDYCLTTKKKTVLADGTVVSDLDYSVIRNSLTPLTADEEEYCDSDVEILYEWAHYYYEAYVKQCDFMPMTSTGIIRKAVQQEYDEKTNSKDWEHTFSLHPEFTEYIRVMNHLYRGGFTYASRAKAGHVIEKVRGMDFTSSYPAVLLQEKFPMSEFKYKRIDKIDQLKDWIKKNPNKCWYADFYFISIIKTTDVAVENMSKLHEWTGNPAKLRKETGCVIDNGKIAFADRMTVTLCDKDFETYERYYEWDDVVITDFMYADYGYLPEWFTCIIKHYYKMKDYLKNNGMKGTTEYALSKAIVNGLYGLTVEKIHFDKIVLSAGEWDNYKKSYKSPEQAAEMMEIYEKAIGREKKTKKLNGGIPKAVLSPYWGVWCTAIARNRILQAISELGNDFVYCDTDSVYMEHYDNHKAWFDRWNDSVHTWNDNNLIDKEFHTLGDFDPVELDENEAPDVFEYNFKSMGAKRYIKWSGDAIHVTVAGLPHGSMRKRAANEVGKDRAEQVKWIVDNFDDGLTIAAEEALKNAHKYIDEPIDALVEDKDGRKEYMHEESSMLIYPIEFTMKLDKEFKKIMGRSVQEFTLMLTYQRLAEKLHRDQRIL